METKEFDFNNYHRKFVNNTEQYHRRQVIYIDKDDLCNEVENRVAVLGQLGDLLSYISDKSYCLINAFSNSVRNAPRGSLLIDKELELFTDVISSLLNLMSHREDIRKWCYELLVEQKHLNPNIQLNPNSGEDAIKIGESDLNLLIEGFKRVLNNPDLSIVELNSIISWITNTDVQLGLKIKLKNKYIEFKQKITLLLIDFDYSKITHEDTYQLGSFFNIIHSNYSEIKIEDKFIEKLIEVHKESNDYWFLVFRMINLLDDEFIFKKITREWLNGFFIELRNEINSLGKELYGEAYPEFKELEEYNKLKKVKQKEGQSMEMKNRATFKKNTSRNWYPRYAKVKEKMNSLKTCHPHGHKIYNLLISHFSHLKALEHNQFNRYIFNKEKKWW